jgi:methyltransferase (TIGR00027 family)
MIEGRPSRTAFMTALQRGYHDACAAEPKILNDNLALDLAGVSSAEAKVFIDNLIKTFEGLSDFETANTFMHRINCAVCMRSRVVEEKLLLAQKRNTKQLVILGAGLDSTAYRRFDLTKGLQIFEVDHPSTQIWKRQKLEQANIKIPENLKFVAFDFEKQTLSEAFNAGHIRTDRVTFFTWLGVQMYLTDQAVRATLKVLGRYPIGSELIMDFISPSYVLEGGISEKSVDYLQKVVTDMGEPVKSKYYEHDLKNILQESGFSNVNFLSAKWLVDNYLDGNKTFFDMPDMATSILSATI